MAASESALGELHATIATVIKDNIYTTILVPDASDPEAPMQEKQIVNDRMIDRAITFLKNNNITCAPEKGTAADELRKRVEEARKKREGGASITDLNEAREAVNFRNG